jgi:hypothetical protein
MGRAPFLRQRPPHNPGAMSMQRVTADTDKEETEEIYEHNHAIIARLQELIGIQRTHMDTLGSVLMPPGDVARMQKILADTLAAVSVSAEDAPSTDDHALAHNFFWEGPKT